MRRASTLVNLKLAPGAWDTWLYPQPLALKPEAEDGFESRAIHPTRRARVPCPPAAPRMRPYGINIARRHIGLDLVFVQTCARRSVIDRIQKREEFTGAGSRTRPGISHSSP